MLGHEHIDDCRTHAKGMTSILTGTAAALALTASIALVGTTWQGSDYTLSGRPAIVDGDTLRLQGQRIRLAGIDAPEMAQTCRLPWVEQACGRDSRDVLQRLAGNAEIRCAVQGHDRYRRALATCWRGSLNLNAEMVRQGWAVAYRRYSLAYVIEEEDAKAQRRGIWQGTFEEPEQWRHRHDR